VALGVVVAGLLVAGAVWAVGQVGGGSPADTTIDRSTDPDGVAAMVLLVESFGARVERAGTDRLEPGAGEAVDAVLVLPGVVVAGPDRQRLDEWVAGGGRLVEVDRAGGERVDPFGFGPTPLAGLGCPLLGLEDVALLEVDADDVVASPDVTETACFEAPQAGAPPGMGFLVVEDVGAGTVVRLGGISPLTNALLDRADNSVLATSLFAPVPGSRLVLLEGAAGLPRSGGGTSSGQGGVGGGTGGDTPESELPGDDGEDPAAGDDPPGLEDHVPEGIRWGLVQLLVAFLVYVAWRGRRVGPPVEEPAPVEVDGSQLVAAVGTLLARTRSTDRAAQLLRADVARLLAARLGLPPATDPLVLCEAAAARMGLDEARCRMVLAGPAPDDGEGLVALAAQLDDLREEIRDGVPA
jgi:hypothetical protein